MCLPFVFQVYPTHTSSLGKYARLIITYEPRIHIKILLISCKVKYKLHTNKGKIHPEYIHCCLGKKKCCCIQ